ncbi:MADPRT [Symbiodinium natans]|uniref:NAD(P)(+)--arginine ADP-ribosyltransferase n=1 Tax=Symbiodinium natans TaxID=878477 RepID=A0A812V009_9DINO|nr:MADPRT [Symbiodinium natans]
MGEEYFEWTVPQLKEHLRALGVASTGSRDFLLQRMKMFASPGKAKPATAKAATLPISTSSKASKAKPAASKLKVAKALAKAPKATKGKKSVAADKKKLARSSSKRTEDLGDLHSPVASLNGCLKKVPTVDVSKAVFGPGPCLMKALPGKAPEAKMRRMLEAHEFECKALKPAGLSLQQRLAIRLYTAEDPIPIYKVLNAPFHASSRSPSTIANQAPFLKVMAQAVKALTKAGKAYTYSGPAYRGIKVAKSPLLKKKYTNYRDTFKVGSRLTFAAFTSVSLSDSTAESFGDRILFQFTNVRGVRIADLSAIPSELEILVEPPAVFEVKSCAKFHGVLSVVLESVESPMKYL